MEEPKQEEDKQIKTINKISRTKILLHIDNIKKDINALKQTIESYEQRSLKIKKTAKEVTKEMD